MLVLVVMVGWIQNTAKVSHWEGIAVKYHVKVRLLEKKKSLWIVDDTP